MQRHVRRCALGRERTDRVDDRFRDLIDLQLVEHALDDQDTRRDTAAACREIFTLRGKHDWSPSIKVVAGWEEG